MAGTQSRLLKTLLVAAGGCAALALLDARQLPVDAGDGSVAALAVPRRFAQPPGRGPGDRWSDVGHPTFNSPHASPIVVNGGYIYVANTPADTVDVIEASSRSVVARVDVGIDPVGLAVRPDGLEVWAANHVSDSVSVIDTDPVSVTYRQVVATVQDFDRETGATRFDEPVGIAFASNAKAYVALSSENQVAVIDVGAREVVNRLAITAQDPRALVVRDGLLYVIPFESNNQTQISGCRGRVGGELCTFDAQVHVVDNNNVLSLGIDVDIVKHPGIPDRDLYVFETGNDRLVDVVSTVGTLLYGLAVDSGGRVFVAQTEARNDANGRAGTEKEGLAEMENRAFLNRITRVDCQGGVCGAPAFIELEPLPPVHPAPGLALATPFAIQISEDDSTLVVSAAGSDKLFTVDASSGNVLGRTDVDAAPRGIALQSNADGGPAGAWVLNAVANTVSHVDVSDSSAPRVVATIGLDDPTHAAVKRGRVAFNDAEASTTGTFSCESCHPDGHTDQLVWVLNTPVCDRQGCTQIPPRSTMPIRGLRDTAPYHWDGIPGDPYGGVNTASTRTGVAPNCDIGDEESCTRFLVDATLRTTMCLVGECPVNDEGKAGALSGAERDDLAKFLLSVPYPPAQRRSYSNVLSDDATTGFKRFHMHGVPDGSDGRINTCGNCHRMPFWVSTNTPFTGMDAPTWRGAYDRWLILPQGRWNVIDLRGQSDRDNAFPERSVWGALRGQRAVFWDMVVEGSTGFSGAFARQVTLNHTSGETPLTEDLLDALELAAREGAILLRGEGLFLTGAAATSVALQFDSGFYSVRGDDAQSFSRAELMALAAEGRFVGTFTARLGVNVDVDHPQPALWSVGPIQEQRGAQEFPSASDGSILVGGRHIREGASVFVNGRRVPGHVRCEGGQLPDCLGERVVIELQSLPGIHFVQVQNPDGLFSNDFIFFGRPLGGDGETHPIPRTDAQETAVPERPSLPGPSAPRSADGVGGEFAALDGTRFRTKTVVSGLEVPTGLAFAPDGRLFVAELPGRVRVVKEGRLVRQPALTLGEALATGDEFLLGITLDPEFERNHLVYLLQARVGPNASPVARIVRYREMENTLAEAAILLDDLPLAALDGGGALRFGPDGLLYVALGDADSGAAQDMASYGGKILRLRPDGTTPRDNPRASPVYSMGHRDPRGLAWHPVTGALWVAEPGRPGTTELNRVEAGGNYGWPGGVDEAMLPGMRRPDLLVSESMVVGGAAFYAGSEMGGFQHDLFLAALDGAHLLRVLFDRADPDRIVGTERLLKGEFGRLRDVVAGPDGELVIATGNRDGRGEPRHGDDRIVRLLPAQ
ncbi:MAG: hypothetical protein F4Z04_07360 [Acidobacteria bacterium]|nr:hypothetical protein [Acidobacteriota bacterium]